MEIKNLLGGNFKVQKINENSKEGTFIFTNLPNEFAITLGNYLRRILLSYTNGLAISGVKIGNNEEVIKSEFISLKGLLETPPYLILNLKKLNFVSKGKKLNFDEIIKLKISINNETDDEYIVTGSDVQFNENVEILNPDVYIATISARSNLNIDLFCVNSYGFRKESDNKKLKWEDGLILIDSDHNPVKNVFFKVDLIVVDLDKQEEQLTLNIKTNGSITSNDALLNALNISKEINEIILNELNIS